jgi:hypothetical protein
MGAHIEMNVAESCGEAWTMPESVGVSGVDGMSMSIHLERAPDALLPDRLAINVRIPLDTIRTLTFPTTEYIVTSRPIPDRKDCD